MTKRVLDVGNCAMDHDSIRALVERGFGADTVQAESLAAALQHLRQETFDLVLVNRIFDADPSEGIDLIREMQSDERLRGIPVMLLTNFDEPQRQAIAAGAKQGFGKAELHSRETQEKLARFLTSD